ncbi:GTPase HflX [Calycomorphotria hydatis]|uniref:GTPase HflX n=1 Tax=Calycomorphotria hydatis TaxID=2528027 RepID=A0A517T3H2_9PLAN|nr:GTPase HflX [Calycomorphotria hydatis]QDT62927.1 GTPase HflX [Calycomorphotria hydatis]
MGDPKREQLDVKEKRAVLAAVISPDSPISKEEALHELQGLVETAGVTVVGEIVQVRDNPHPAHCMGPGKVEELKELAKATDAELIVFDNNLSPAQGKRLEEETETVIVDRSEVILDIFASNARTYEAKLQVELAQLLYFRPRLKRLWTHLERIEGGVGAGRGPGEKQLETDRRLLDKRVAELKRKLKEVEQRRERTVESRYEMPTVSLVGYTNAGKSTLMRALTGSDVFVANKLFATLDTRTRKWHVPKLGDVLLSDTVGFVRNLPHHLVASFRSTLEEARHADLLLHVVDASNPEAEHQIATVYEVLEEIGVSTENVQLVLNKVDAAEADRTTLDILHNKYPEAVSISAATGVGLEPLAEIVANRLGDGFVVVELDISAGNGRLLAYLKQHVDILDEEYVGDRLHINCRMSRMRAERIYGDTALLGEDSTFVQHPPVKLTVEDGELTAVGDIASVKEPA